MISGNTPKRVLLIGGGGREHAIAEALCRKGNICLFVIAHNDNPGIASIAELMVKHDEKDTDWITRWAREKNIDFAVIGLEDPLAVGLPDSLADIGIPTVGPSKAAAQLETSKLFTRELMRKYGIPGQIDYRYITDVYSLRQYLLSTEKQYALKAVGLAAGKGVQVMGIQLNTVNEAIAYGEKVIREKIGGVAGLIVEERMVGPEFTLQAFVDGNTVLAMPLVRDFKCALEGDRGPNTGGMGSYSQSNGLLSYVTTQQRDEAITIIQQVINALRSEGIVYKGILYGQFMVTSEGIRLIEFNARFGDPEAINVLPLLKNDFVEICQAILAGSLHSVDLQFEPMATVCKYITPPQYGFDPIVGSPLSLNVSQIEPLGVNVYYAKVDVKDGTLLTTSSRTVALLKVADSVFQAEAVIEKALKYVEGDFHVRHDIGKDVSYNSAIAI